MIKLPAFAQVDTAACSALVHAITDETEAVTQRYRDEDKLNFTMSTHIAAAYTRYGSACE